MVFTRATAALAAILIFGVSTLSVEATSRCECRIESSFHEGDVEQTFADVDESAGPEAGYPYRYISKNTDQYGQHTFVTFRVVRHEEQIPANCGHTSFLVYFKTFQTVFPWLQYWQSGVPYLRREVQKGEALRIGTTGETYEHKLSENLVLTVRALDCRDVTENLPPQSGDSLEIITNIPVTSEENRNESIETEDSPDALQERDGSSFVEERGENSFDGSLSDGKSDEITSNEESVADSSDSESDEATESDERTSEGDSDEPTSEEDSDEPTYEGNSDEATSEGDSDVHPSDTESDGEAFEGESDEEYSEEGSQFKIELFD